MLITRGSNNYRALPVPREVGAGLHHRRASTTSRMPVYGDGRQRRDWLYVDDHCAGIDVRPAQGRAGRGLQHRRRQRASTLAAGRARSSTLLGKPRDLIQHVPDRPGHDRRYCGRHRASSTALGWAPPRDVRDGARTRPCAGTSRTRRGGGRCKERTTRTTTAATTATRTHCCSAKRELAASQRCRCRSQR